MMAFVFFHQELSYGSGDSEGRGGAWSEASDGSDSERALRRLGIAGSSSRDDDDEDAGGSGGGGNDGQPA